MPALESDLRRQLESVIIEAREVAEAAARSKLTNLGVAAPEAFNDRDREIRNRLRARGRQAGDVRNADKTQSIEQITQELAYEFWHRMLFARFLAENGLLIDPEHEVSVDLDYCEEIAASKGAANGYVLAARFASKMLPQIFRTDDVLLEVEFAPDQRLALEKLLKSLDRQTFLADDSLGWVYQFWQTAEKKRVNDSGDKIDGHTLPAVTQLFTEHYMVEFLLHNTIGAWWCSKHGIQGSPSEAGVPANMSPVAMPYLRWRDDGTPAAGKFEGWPKTLAEFTMLDPCCGSGHFVVAALNLIVPLRMHDEGLSAEKACDAVLRDNLFGLEIDPRCTQIAAFALALAAWKYPDAGGHRTLPTLNVACSGQGVTAKKDEWLALANSNDRLREGMDRLFDLFQKAPHLGSLIDPRRGKGDLFEAGFAELEPLMSKALAKNKDNPEMAALGVAAQGMARAAHILASRYTLIVTNVPYLGRNKQHDILMDYLGEFYSDEKECLSSAFVRRGLTLCSTGGTTALVAPQSWLFQSKYTKMREKVLNESRLNVIARLGTRAFETITGEVVNVALVAITTNKPSESHTLAGLDVSDATTPLEKANRMVDCEGTPLQLVLQLPQLRHPNFAISFDAISESKRLSEYAHTGEGLSTGDIDKFVFCFWEITTPSKIWEPLHTGPGDSEGDVGLHQILRWDNGRGELSDSAAARIQGQVGWGAQGVLVSEMKNLRACRHVGFKHDKTAGVIIPKKPSHLLAITAFCLSPEYPEAVRSVDMSLKVAPRSLVNVPFDLNRWQAAAEDMFPNGIPVLQSFDPTQWIFKGKVTTSKNPLQVAVASLLGYRWPGQTIIEDAIDKMADSDGILCLPSVRGEMAASERLLELLREAYGKEWTNSVLHKLLTDTGCKAGTSLDDWLRDQFFEQHCKLFQNRPFIWHVWDGRRDGFSVLVNYHKLTHKALDNLTHSYLRDWITAQSKSDKAGADLRLGAAQELLAKLKLILAGEPPYDIFVRWKPLHEQAIGWNPDLDDGMRMNIRPFVKAGILRKNPNVKWSKDRGKEQERDKTDYPWFCEDGEFVGDRVNDVHLTIDKKNAARRRKKGAK
jgi:hypothetical protein